MAQLTEEGTSRFARAGDLNIHYYEAGEGEAVFMLHGGGPGTTAWANFKTNMGQVAEKYRVLAVDQPGFGQSDKPEYSGNLGDFNAKAILDLMDGLGIEKAHFVGNSMGGLTSLKFALNYPDRVGRLVLMGPAVTGHVVGPAVSEGIKMLFSFYDPPGPTVDTVRDFNAMMTFNPANISEAELQERLEKALDPEVSGWMKKMLIGGQAKLDEVWPHYHKIAHKTLLIWGRDDRVVPLDRAFLMLQRMPDARLHVFPKCAHWVMIEYPEAFNRLVINFLALP